MRGAIVILTALFLAACASKEPTLLNAAANSPAVGPDEFGIVPNRPLEKPDDLTALPAPTPGAPNLADADPTGDAVAALGGNPNRGVRASAPLIRAVTRFGLDPGIRAELAAEDAEFRKENRGKPLERWFKVNKYFDAYAPQSLDPWAELARLMRRGISVPAAPPRP